MTWFTRLRPFIMATHFPQAAAMVATMTFATAILGQRGWPLVWVFLAASAGQALVGWLNDYLDASNDAELKRVDKPVVKNQLDVQKLKTPMLVAALLVAPFSLLAAGWVGGFAHIFAVGQGLIYDRFAARTWWSWVPYALAFAAIPVFVAQASARTAWPSWQFALACSLVGVIAHLLNALPDIAIDKQAGLGGLAVTLGTQRTIALTFILVAAAITMMFMAWLGFAE
jgi:4-hydroxybenzoate polyprenyltransferase